MDRVRQVLLKSVERKIMYSKDYINTLNRRYKNYCSDRPLSDEFCKVYYDEVDIHSKRIKIYEHKIEHLKTAPCVSIHDTEILDIDVMYLE